MNMKKIFILLAIGLLSLVSCMCPNKNDEKCNETVDIGNCNDIEHVTINDYYHYNYKKIVLEGHDYYFRSWATRGGHGSDLVHNPNCKTCRLWKR